MGKITLLQLTPPTSNVQSPLTRNPSHTIRAPSTTPSSPMTTPYLTTIHHLETHTNYETTIPQPVDLQLDPIRTLLARLNNPHARPQLIHIAGTKGKGATTTLLAAALAQSAAPVGAAPTGAYLSPHLHSYRERITLNGQPIDPAAFLRAADPVLAAADPTHTTFERLTAIAFQAFADAACPFAVIETGLGGLTDATNVITPILSIITPLSLDHTATLGPTLQHIATHKAGIIKPNTPVIIAPQPPAARAILTATAARLNAPLIDLATAFPLVHRQQFPTHQTLTLHTPRGLHTLTLALPGPHNALNARLVVAACHVLGLPLPTDLTHVTLPGRFETLTLAHRPLILDMAHNPAAAAAFTTTFRELDPGQTATLLLAAPADKDLAGILTALAPIASRLILTTAGHPRSASPTHLADLATRLLTHIPVETFPTLPAALDHALSLSNTAPIAVLGSVHTVAAARTHLATNYHAPLTIPTP